MADAEKTPEVKPSADPIGANLSNEDWLAGVERRDVPIEPTLETHDPAYDYPVAEEVPVDSQPVDAVEAQYEAAADQLAEVQVQTLQSRLAASPTMPSTPAFPDMGIVYAGLETEGVAAFPSEVPSVAPTAFAQPITPALVTPDVAPMVEPDPSPYTTIEQGPLGPEAAECLRTLGLNAGCSWEDVSSTRTAILAALPNTGAPEEQHARAEVNHAAASLRLLRVGPLKL